MKFSIPWGRKRMKKEEYLKKLTLEELKSKHPKVVEAIRRQERAKLYDTLEKMKQRTKELQEEIKRKKEQTQTLTEAKKNELTKKMISLQAQKAKLVLNEQLYERSELIKKKLKNMPSSLAVLLIPVLSSLSSSEDMDSKIEEALKIYQATHPGEPQAGIIEKKELTQKDIEEKRQLQISRDFDEAFS